MSKNLLDATERLVAELTPDEQLRLVKRLEHQTAKLRLERLWAEVDRRRRGQRVTMAEIVREIKAYRRERRGANGSGRR